MFPVSVYAAKVYDGVMLYAQAVEALLQSGKRQINGVDLTKEIINSTYQSTHALIISLSLEIEYLI